ncbi:DUF983 domain-containing protein [Notoacmeibacter sp. MSK16QG-6]|uniref:DUF983 domain-containing protein n=1 Tax=Notoacmeibacter sp. MSK16QG-6 TaxID=2957982 RepID=UPI00209D250E|nr:DUF983 domain-containing protein [Notoacmeibacter sp. MSK16QG-6]MCP1197891.1 DUF983 domain-containing protein [Notoacmeibacter sp. MSK16QG-6]
MKDDISQFGGENHTGRPDRPLGRSILRGAAMRCPNCGEGRLFRSYVRTVDSCEVCQEPIFHHRADDLPAYLVVFIVGHIVVGAYMAAEALVEWSMVTHMIVWSVLIIIAVIAMLPPVKGAVVGLQWALYMHGFGGEPDTIEDHPSDPRSGS